MVRSNVPVNSAAEIKKLREAIGARDLLANSLSMDALVAATITAIAGRDIQINGVTGKDIKFKLTDAAGARKIIILDSADAEVGSIDSNGVFTSVGGFAGALTGNVTGNVNGQCRTTYAHSDTDGAPTNAECVSAFGAAATVGAGFIGIYKDDHESGKTYVCVSNGSAYGVSELTAAA